MDLKTAHTRYCDGSADWALRLTIVDLSTVTEMGRLVGDDITLWTLRLPVRVVVMGGLTGDVTTLCALRVTIRVNGPTYRTKCSCIGVNFLINFTVLVKHFVKIHHKQCFQRYPHQASTSSMHIWDYNALSSLLLYPNCVLV